MFSNRTTVESRLQTYNEWLIAMKQMAKTLAGAGVFYIGRGNRIQCFHCVVEMKELLPYDEIYQRRPLLNDECKYFQTEMVELYAQNVRKKKNFNQHQQSHHPYRSQ